MAGRVPRDRVEQILESYKDGRSFRAIALKLEITRNAVCGIVDRARKRGELDPSEKAYGTRAERIGKAPRAPEPTASEPPSLKPASEPEPHLEPEPEPEPVIPVETPIAATGVGPAVMALRDVHCRWPIGDVADPDFRFCCRPVSVDPSPMPSMRRRYCACHLAAAKA